MSSDNSHARLVPVATTGAEGKLITFRACAAVWELARSRWTPTENKSIADIYFEIIEHERNLPCCSSDVTRLFAFLHEAA